MAKDGTNRGGARVGSGRKPKALADKISKGTSVMVMELPERLHLRVRMYRPSKNI